ncbi:MAG: WG repeat-containing protein, partial [Tannerella sp.]|nr:WG repeat-containing protein [Tannerella sp.]
METKKQDKLRYDFVGHFNEGLAFVKLDGKLGVID